MNPTARLYDTFLSLGERRGMRARRAALLADLRGAVLEIGAGTGLNVPHYPRRGLDRIVLTEPVDAMAERLADRIRFAGVAAEIVGCGAEQLPFPDDSFDAVVSTMVLCTVPDPAAAIAEIRRVLRPGGRFVFIEHLRAEHRPLRALQVLLRRPWRALGDGCRCDQPTLDLLAAGGLSPTVVQRHRWRGMPRIVAPLAVGYACA